MKTLEEMIREHPFFEGMNEKYVKLIAGCGINQVFEPGEALGKEGEPADHFYVLREGKVAVQIFSAHKGEITVQTIGASEVIGWSWLFPPYRWTFDVKAIKRTRVISFNGRCLREKCEENHDLGYVLMKRFSQIMVKRLEATRMQILDVYHEPANQ